MGEGAAIGRSRTEAGRGDRGGTGGREIRKVSFRVEGTGVGAERSARGRDTANRYDARLALGETQTTNGQTNEGRATLRRVAEDAKAHGFVLTAKKALAASKA